jgi:chromosome segregation ATPase
MVVDRDSDRPRLTERDFDSMSRAELWQAYQKLESYLHGVDETEERMNKQLAEAAKRENVLVLRLSAREQELQDVAAVAVKYRQQQASGATLRKTMLDPAINHLFSKMKTELKETKEKLDSAQSELSAWKFTPDSQTGKQLMNRVRTLIQENQELGKQLSSGNMSILESKLQMQEKKNQELTKAQADTDEFVLQLDEETEGLQANIMSLQSKLDKANSRIKELEGDLEGRTDDKKEAKSENTDESSASAYYTPEQLSGYYDQLISAGYMTKEQAKEALDQAKSQINEDGLVPVTFAKNQKEDETIKSEK